MHEGWLRSYDDSITQQLRIIFPTFYKLGGTRKQPIVSIATVNALSTRYLDICKTLSSM